MDLHTTHEKRHGEDLFGLIVLAVGVLLFWQSYRIAGFEALSSPGAFPMAASAAMVVSALIVVAGNLRRRARVSGEPVLPRIVALFALLVAGFAVALVPLGFVLSSLLFLLLGMRLLHRRSWAYCAVVAVGSLAVVYVIFRVVFQVVLPEGVLPEGEILSAIGRALGGGGEAAQ